MVDVKIVEAKPRAILHPLPILMIGKDQEILLATSLHGAIVMASGDSVSHIGELVSYTGTEVKLFEGSITLSNKE